jgi:PleD family two-component response regulator
VIRLLAISNVSSVSQNSPLESQVAKVSCSLVSLSSSVRVSSSAIRAIAFQTLFNKRILWVDDRPENNLYPRRALEALGIQVTTSTSTQDALEKLRIRSHFQSNWYSVTSVN